MALRTPHRPRIGGHTPAPRLHSLPVVLVALVAVVAAVAPTGAAHAGDEAFPPSGTVIEDYAPYQPQTRCRPKAKPGALALARWLEQRGGRIGGISRRCGAGTSEHYEGRAVDWMLDARRPDDRRAARALIRELRATDADGNQHALARRMGVMYVIWADRIWRSYDRFRPRPYLHGGCRTKRRCSRTLRHRDHVHISLSRPGGRGVTSWYADRAR